jgi:hypothetical protein
MYQHNHQLEDRDEPVSPHASHVTTSMRDAWLQKGYRVAEAKGLSGLEAEEFAEDFAQGSERENVRIATILQSREAADRMEAAKHLAFRTDMPAAEAIAFLASSPAVRQAVPQRASTAPLGLVLDGAGQGSASALNPAAIYAKRNRLAGH